ncbi:MAG TPA: cyclopropane-fatty-acyl-phospholipid synthase family protein [Steroidobacteraceae bacterium]|nr:cyclopropane-fatty-acyl-phospholipid synthase family protein [Steroidobacteraceae bacterium]
MSANSGFQEQATVTPPSDTESGPGREASIEARLLRRMLATLGDPPIEFVLSWNGEHVKPANGTPVATLRLADRNTLFGLLADPTVRFGDSYSAGDIEVDGDLIALVSAVHRSMARVDVGSSLSRLVAGWIKRPRRNTPEAARENIHHHYDLGNDFYALWLGETMAYTCAYYPTAQATLEQAQIAKMDHVCRKLRLKAGDTVVEAGCGWGTLAMHMASRYGAKVRAYNISTEQIAFARERAAKLGLTGRVEFVHDDYRNITGHYDVFASVGMLEHVGRGYYQDLGRIARRSLTAVGRGLIHSIGRNRPAPLDRWIERRIFPGAYAPSLGEMMPIFEPNDFSVLDVENIRLHYALTLRHWLERFTAAEQRVRAMFDEHFVRMWRLYLAGSVAAFESGTLQLFQVLFTTQENNDIPLTRQFIYQN